jgi:hypothetical protein
MAVDVGFKAVGLDEIEARMERLTQQIERAGAVLGSIAEQKFIAIDQCPGFSIAVPKHASPQSIAKFISLVHASLTIMEYGPIDMDWSDG